MDCKSWGCNTWSWAAGTSTAAAASSVTPSPVAPNPAAPNPATQANSAARALLGRRSACRRALLLDCKTTPRFSIDPSQVTCGPQQPPLEGHDRSEEHTSELQSLMRISYAVFCLKKKN